MVVDGEVNQGFRRDVYNLALLIKRFVLQCMWFGMIMDICIVSGNPSLAELDKTTKSRRLTCEGEVDNMCCRDALEIPSSNVLGSAKTQTYCHAGTGPLYAVAAASNPRQSATVPLSSVAFCILA